MTPSTTPERAPTATLFNETYAYPPPTAPTRIPPAVRRIVIVGGGSAGWMTAMILANALLRHGIDIAVVESPNVGIIGVVDCTGFAGLLIRKALGTPFLSFADNLFNDAAIAIPSPMGDSIPCQTVSTALRHGWRWIIPLTSRYGNGYVYSSAFCSADEAERELRESLGLLDSDTPARHLKMKIGRVTQHWNRNCLAVGLAQGFIEPLEATALLFIQRTASTFVEFLEAGDLGGAAHERFNQRLNDHFEGTRDYIVTHYKTNTRKDTEYWRANAANTHLSEPLKHLYALWMSGRSIAPEIARQAIGKGYPVFSWYCIMSGMGIYPDRASLRPPSAHPRRSSMSATGSGLVATRPCRNA